MDDWKIFSKALIDQFDYMAQHEPFKSDVSSEAMWLAFLAAASLPPDTVSRNWSRVIENGGDVLAMIDSELVSIWDVTVANPKYQLVANALSALNKDAQARKTAKK